MLDKIDCCTEMSEKSVVQKCCGDVPEKSVGKKSVEKCWTRNSFVEACRRRVL